MKKKKKRTINKLSMIICLIILLSRIIFLKIDKAFSKIVNDYAINKIESIVSIIIKESFNEYIKSDNVKDSEYYKISKNSDGEIIGLDFNVMEVNKILINIMDNVQNNVRLLERGKYKYISENILDDNIIFKGKKESVVLFVPLGIINKVLIISDLGPKIPVRLSFVGNSFSNIDTKLSEYGINNVFIESFIVININVQVIMPFSTKKIIITERIPLSMNLINGKIPQVYGGEISTSTPLLSTN